MKKPNYDMDFLVGNKCWKCRAKLWEGERPRGKRVYECSKCGRKQYPVSLKDFARALARAMYDYNEQDVRQKEIRLNEIAELVGYNPSTVYNWVYKKSVRERKLTDDELIKYVNICPTTLQIKYLTNMGFYHPTPAMEKLLTSDKPIFEDENDFDLESLFEQE
jgi:hypothetical protein